jgi:pyridoxamine 5'-phosphate oxidase
MMMTVHEMSSDRSGIFAGDDPFALARDWYGQAKASEPNDPDAVALATVDASGMPNVRMVLLRDIEAGAFTFYTNYQSQKAVEIEGAGKAALVFHWKSLRRQIRVRGTVVREDGVQADAYYASRGLKSRLGAWASAQSQPIADRGVLMARLDAATAQYGDAPPRPAHWGGFRITPIEIEFWADGDARLHDRFRWTRATGADAWKIARLSP